MNIVVAGSTGMVGRALLPALRSRGYSVVSLVRGAARHPDEAAWLPDGRAPVAVLDRADAVVNLAGASIAGARWTDHRRKVLRESRIGPTRALVAALAASGRGRRVLVNASATGFYGDTGERTVTEEAPLGAGFLAEICRDWEAEARQAEAAGIRVVCTRFGVILGQGGALARMEPLFRWGLGGRLGSGSQWMSWIGLRDAVSAIVLALETDRLRGPVNLCSPEPVRNRFFTLALAAALNRHVGLPVPALALRALYGQMGQETLLASTRALPLKLGSVGYPFIHERLQDALPEGLVHA